MYFNLEVKRTGYNADANKEAANAANGSSNMLFNLEMWPDVPPGFSPPIIFSEVVKWKQFKIPCVQHSSRTLSQHEAEKNCRLWSKSFPSE